MGAVIKTRKSKQLNSQTYQYVQVKDSQEIVDKYLSISTIEGIISL
jgi:hypothetical protein